LFQSSDGIPITVFHGTYADHTFTQGQAGGLTRSRRLQRAIHGEGFPETRILEIVFWNTEEEAVQTELEQLLGKIVRAAPSR
jgi:hypothetical protein